MFSHSSGKDTLQEARVRRGQRSVSHAMHWVHRYTRAEQVIRLEGWDAEPLAPIRRRKSPGEGGKHNGRSGSADLAMIENLCTRVGTLPSGYRLGMTLTDHSMPDGRFVDRLGDILTGTRFSPNALRLVLCEGCLIDADRDCALALAVLIDWGIELWLGRFGQAVSSLSVLRDRAASGLLTGISLDVSLVTAHSGIWRGVGAEMQHGYETLDPAAEQFYASVCQGLQALGLKTHLAHITSSLHYNFAVSAGFDELSGSCPELDGVAENGKPPCF